MRGTPAIPAWIRAYRSRSYTNIYQLCPDETRLFGTESLYGDWDADLLLLAKDFAPSRLVRQRLAAGEERPYHHTDWHVNARGPGARTNRALYRLAERIGCRKLYGSALVGLLRDDEKVSGALADAAAITPFVCEALRFTIGQMPNLRAIACLGADAWQWATRTFGHVGADWREHRDARRPLQADRLTLFALPHPSRTPGGTARVEGDWDAIARAMAT